MSLREVLRSTSCSCNSTAIAVDRAAPAPAQTQAQIDEKLEKLLECRAVKVGTLSNSQV
jgi:hypothetical protein